MILSEKQLDELIDTLKDIKEYNKYMLFDAEVSINQKLQKDQPILIAKSANKRLIDSIWGCYVSFEIDSKKQTILIHKSIFNEKFMFRGTDKQKLLTNI